MPLAIPGKVAAFSRKVVTCKDGQSFSRSREPFLCGLRYKTFLVDISGFPGVTEIKLKYLGVATVYRLLLSPLPLGPARAASSHLNKKKILQSSPLG